MGHRPEDGTRALSAGYCCCRIGSGKKGWLTTAGDSIHDREDRLSLGLEEGDVVQVESRRGYIIAPVRIGDIREGTVFAPFHYGYWDQDGGSATGHSAANELTTTEWDPVSKQPVLKNAAVKVTKVTDGLGPSLAPTTTASRPARNAKGHRRILPTAGGPAGQAQETIAPVEPPVVAMKEERA